MTLRVAVLTISDAGHRGERADTSGDAIVSWVAGREYALAQRALVPDDTVAIVRTLLAWTDGSADLILTTGGTGLTERDLTPEATRAVLEREAPGIAEALRNSGSGHFPRA
ncbi:MAG TPA: molybdopterin-binding protein, partial [Gemmatimonadales bacterium]|nr:molybdopterin-binding protein [Gemmatimonadales bacterium]